MRAPGPLSEQIQGRRPFMPLSKQIKILLVEDSKLDAELILIELERHGFELQSKIVYERTGLTLALSQQTYDIILSDIILPGFSGAEALRVARALAPETPFIFVSGIFGEVHAVEMMRLGANDYVLKQSMELLAKAVERALLVVHERRERRRAEEALHSLEVRSRLAMDASRLGMWEYLPASGTLIWDERCKAMFGLPADTVVDLAVFERLCGADGLERFLDTVRQAGADERDDDYRSEYRIRLDNGAQRWVETRGQPFFDAGVCTRFLGVMLDITQQRDAAEKLERLNVSLGERVEERTRERDRTWDLTRDLLLVCQPDGILVALNPAWEENLGWSRLELLGSSLLTLVHPDERFITENELEQLATRAASQRFVNRIRHRDGSYRWISWTAVPDAGMTYCSGRDISSEVLAMEELAAANRQLREQIDERERVEATLQQMQRLEAVGQLTAGVAHDFNNLLTVILSSASFLERDLTRLAANDKTQGRVQNIREAGERGAKLTAQLLAFSRRQRLAPKPVKLNETVEGMLELLRSTMGGSVWIETHLRADCWHALVDPTQIELIILNLAINARDAMAVGGTLRLSTSNQTISQAPQRPEEPEPGEYVLLAVQDSGTGMSEEVLAKAFEPFFTTKEVGKGSGLGLAQVFGFAKQSGGGVRIETQMGSGTTVLVYLPRTEAEDALEPVGLPALGRDEQAAERRILLVDDDHAVRNVTAALLADLGYQVVEASNGFAALSALERDPQIDLLLADFAMPGMNGAELARQARKRLPQLPVVFITGYAELGELDPEQSFIVPKPFREADLAARLQAALRGEKPQPSPL